MQTPVGVCALRTMDIKTAIAKATRMVEYRQSEEQCVLLASLLRTFVDQHQEFLEDDGVLDDAAGLLESLSLMLEHGRINLARELDMEVRQHA